MNKMKCIRSHSFIIDPNENDTTKPHCEVYKTSVFITSSIQDINGSDPKTKLHI